MHRWKPYQQERLALERRLIADLAPDFRIVDPLGSTHVSGSWTSNGGVTYRIRINIPAGYPDECPKTYIESPFPLLDHRGESLTRHGTSHEYHLWKSDRRGTVQICTFRPEWWNASNSLFQTIRKARLWITAYEIHRRNGALVSELLMDARPQP